MTPILMATSAILAIDPGPVRSAWLWLLNGKPEEFQIVTNEDLLFELRSRSTMWDGEWCAAIEQVEGMGMAVGKEVFETVRWAGRFEEALHPVPVHMVTRRQVKLHLCGSMKAKDPNIRQALIDRFGGGEAIGTTKNRGPLYGISKDVWSALAIAVTFLDGEEGS